MAPIAVPVEEHGRHLAMEQITNGTLKDQEVPRNVSRRLTPEQDLVLKTIRLLMADLCQQFKGGHPGYVYHH